MSAAVLSSFNTRNVDVNILQKARYTLAMQFVFYKQNISTCDYRQGRDLGLLAELAVAGVYSNHHRGATQKEIYPLRPMVTICTTCFNIPKLCIQPTQCLCVPYGFHYKQRLFPLGFVAVT
jgi:hypothetical protein